MVIREVSTLEPAALLLLPGLLVGAARSPTKTSLVHSVLQTGQVSDLCILKKFRTHISWSRQLQLRFEQRCPFQNKALNYDKVIMSLTTVTISLHATHCLIRGGCSSTSSSSSSSTSSSSSSSTSLYVSMSQPLNSINARGLKV